MTPGYKYISNLAQSVAKSWIQHARQWCWRTAHPIFKPCWLENRTACQSGILWGRDYLPEEPNTNNFHHRWAYSVLFLWLDILWLSFYWYGKSLCLYWTTWCCIWAWMPYYTKNVTYRKPSIKENPSQHYLVFSGKETYFVWRNIRSCEAPTSSLYGPDHRMVLQWKLGSRTILWTYTLILLHGDRL